MVALVNICVAGYKSCVVGKAVDSRLAVACISDTTLCLTD